MARYAAARTCIVVMGPSGVGKTTIAEALADRLGWSFAETDKFHPKANIDKMSAGIPLDDDDRAPWLALIRDWVTGKALAGRDVVITCSALKRRYRDVLRQAEARVRFLELVASPALVEARMSKRRGHYMPVSLLASQFAALEELEPDEDGIKVDVSGTPEATFAAVLAALDLAPPKPAPSQAAAPDPVPAPAASAGRP
jgi:gluconokinase